MIIEMEVQNFDKLRTMTNSINGDLSCCATYDAYFFFFFLTLLSFGNRFDMIIVKTYKVGIGIYSWTSTHKFFMRKVIGLIP